MPLIFTGAYSSKSKDDFGKFANVSKETKLRTQTLYMPADNTTYEDLNKAIAFKQKPETLMPKEKDDLRKPKAVSFVDAKPPMMIKPGPPKTRKPLPFEVEQTIADAAFLNQQQANDEMEQKIKIAQ